MTQLRPTGAIRQVFSPFHILTLPLYVIMCFMWGVAFSAIGYTKFIVLDGAFTGFPFAILKIIRRTHLFVFDFGFIVNMNQTVRSRGVPLLYLPGRLYALYRRTTMWMARVTLSTADRLFVYSDEMERVYCHLGATQSRITRYCFPVNIPSEVQMRPVNRDLACLEKRSGEIFLVYIGRLTPDKDLPSLLEAFRRVIAHTNAIKLVVAGDGPMKSELKTRSSTSDGNLIFIGRLDHREDVEALLRLCDIFVYPMMVSGGYSMSVLEAMAAGKPVIVTDVGPTGDLIVQGVNGIKVPLGSISKLEQAINLLANDVNLRRTIGTKAKTSIPPQFSTESFHHTLTETLLQDS